MLAASFTTLAIVGCNTDTDETKTDPVVKTTPEQKTEKAPSDTPATSQEAKEFLEAAQTDLAEIYDYAGKVAWVKANFVTEDTNYLEAKANEEFGLLSTRLANEAKRFNELNLPEDMARKMDIIKRGSNFPAPDRDGAAKELAEIMTELDSMYASGSFNYISPDPQFASFYEGNSDGELNLGQLSQIIAQSRDPVELQTVWEGWRTVSPAMKKKYADMVEIVNEGSKELGYADTGMLWRAGYDMEGEAFAAEADRLWGQVKPLYDELHCYVRAELNEEYGDEVVPLDQPIRADLLGNMWGQSWGNIYEISAPEDGGKNIDLTGLLGEKEYDELRMVKVGETFFTSMGFDPLPETFWTRSLFVKPADRIVQCHASAWDMDYDDYRIKMCININAEDFSTIHHELGHNFYQRAYRDQPIFYRNGANDGFHEAIGDMIALSITPDYLVEIGLLDSADVPGPDDDIALLMRQALDKVAFLPFGIMIDQWRWKVFSGEYEPSEYNDGWWELREQYQGIRPPSARPSSAFDPGAKYHIPGNTPYMRYFLAHILQFQFHKAACDMAGNDGPLHRCSVYGNKQVGDRFGAMMEMGASKPWPDALEAFTGTRDMDGSAVVEYFAPLMEYLEEENEGRICGW
ncbi:MAG: M2 family metallopeptidase [Hellea sp.]|nr:M2 family metallopeptidase [Hellea sp.]